MQAQLTTPTFGDERLPARFWAKVRIGSVPTHRPDLGPCWEWTGARNDNGYGYFSVGSRTDGTRKMIRAHRLAFEMLTRPIPAGLEPDHLCRNRACSRSAHIELVTSSVNHQRGDRAKLTAGQVREIRRFRGTISQRKLAARFGVSRGVINNIQHSRIWRHV